MISANLLESIVQNLDKERFDTILENPHIKIERIVSKGHTSPDSGWHDQPHNEWVLLLSGNAVIRYKNERDTHLKAGDHVLLPAHKKHKVSWTNPETESVWLAVHYPSE